jgi:hypothetical protein
MDPVDEFARLRAQIKELEDRAATLRAQFLHPGARLRSNQHEVVVRRQTRRVFHRDLLPPAVLHDPLYWTETRSETVLVRALEKQVKSLKENEDIVLVEPFWPAPGINHLVTRG